MTETFSPTTGNSPGNGSHSPSDTAATREVAVGEVRSVAQDGLGGGKQTAETAKEQAGDVAAEAMTQAKALLDQTRSELSAQGSVQQEKAASGLHSLADELKGLIDGTGSQDGVVADLAREASQRVRSAASWLESREPGEVIDDVRRFARQRPGTFLLSAALVGVIGGRLTRGLATDAKDETPASGAPAAGSAHVTPALPVQPTPTSTAPDGHPR